MLDTSFWILDPAPCIGGSSQTVGSLLYIFKNFALQFPKKG